MAPAVDAWGIGTYEWQHTDDAFVASRRFLELYGLSAGARTAAEAWSAVHPDDQPRSRAAIQAAMDPRSGGQLDLVHRVLHPDGKVLWLHQRSQTHFVEAGGRLQPQRTFGSVMDVTERKHIEQELRRTETRFEEAVRAAQFGIFEHNHIEDPKAENVYWSPRMREIFGVTDDERGSATTLLSRVHPDDIEGLHRAVARAHDPGGSGYYDVEHRYLHPTLGMRWLLTRSSTHFGEVSGQRVPVRTVGAVLDVTARRKSEQEHEQRAQILDATSDFVAIVEPDGSLVYLNHAGRAFLGIGPAEDLAGRTLHWALPPESLRRLLSEGMPSAARDGAWRVEAEFLRRDGSIVLMSEVLLSHRGRDGQVVLYSTIARDISRERALEEHVRQSQKMEAVGRLAGGIAHDFNNMLCAVLGFAHLAAREIGPMGKAHAHVAEIIGVGERAAALTQQLLAFSRRQVLHPRVVDVGAILTRMAPMIRRLVGEHIEVLLSLPATSVRVKADPTHLEQVVLNLAINAGDAMPNGGRLDIACKHADVDAPVTASLDLPRGRYAVIAVSDNGAGMDAQTQARLFEPFFTTKAPGRGTGMGLATVFGIVKQSGGGMHVQSEVGRGSIFEAYIPSSAEPLTQEPPRANPPRAPRNAVILVAEDDRLVRQVVVTVLRRAGYLVLESTDPEHALQLSREQAGPIDLLLTDVVMPMMNGKELARRLCTQRPGLPVLYMSGYADEAFHGVVDADVHFLAKPISPDQLLTAVEEVFVQARARSA
jgi:two-component system, cell cycle sensor histidine kinase and response regulator CckA